MINQKMDGLGKIMRYSLSIEEYEQKFNPWHLERKSSDVQYEGDSGHFSLESEPQRRRMSEYHCKEVDVYY